MMTPLPPPKLDDLYSRVSLAIHLAEKAEGYGDTVLAAAMYLDVSGLEEEIAELVAADSTGGAIARRGVLTAALAAGQHIRAVEMAEKYLADPQVAGPLRERLIELRTEGQQGLDAICALPDDVEPAARFHFPAAA